MIRAPMGDQAYWDTRVNSDIERLGVMTSSLEEVPSKNPPYDPQYAFLLTERYLRLILRRYSRGDPVSELGQYIPGLLDAWELSNRLAEAVCREHHLSTCRDWVFDLTNLNHYNWCFWLIGLALALDSPEAQWQRLLALIGGEGEDVLLDRIIASRQSTRPIGTKLLHKKPYARLLKAIDAPKAQQAGLLRDFVDHWYAELARPGKDELWIRLSIRSRWAVISVAGALRRWLPSRHSAWTIIFVWGMRIIPVICCVRMGQARIRFAWINLPNQDSCSAGLGGGKR